MLYVRPFERDNHAFRWVQKEELLQYTSRPATFWSSIRPVSLEQYLGAAFTARIGPMVALGNPFDFLPSGHIPLAGIDRFAARRF